MELNFKIEYCETLHGVCLIGGSHDPRSPSVEATRERSSEGESQREIGVWKPVVIER